MTGENEHERETGGDPLPPDDPMPEFEMDSSESVVSETELSEASEPDTEVSRPSRRFRAWGAAQVEDTGPSFWRRTSERIKRLFTRPTPAELDSDAAPSFEQAQESWPAADAVEVASASAADEPKEDLKFLRTGESDAIPDPSVAGVDLHEGPPVDVDPLGEPVAELPPEPPRKKRASLLKRVFFTPIVFGPRAKKVEVEEEEVPDTDETEIPDAIELPPEEPAEIGATQPIDVSSLDEALPMDSPATEPFELGHYDAIVPEVEPEQPKKVGFFAKLFGRKAAEAPPPDEFEAEPLVEADAVGQLDAVDEGFEAARSEFATPEHSSDQSFASVDDALPLDSPILEATFDAQPAVTASSFAPPPVEADAPSAPVAAGSDEHQFFGGNTFDFDTPKADDRSTLELAPVDDRKTAEVTADVTAHADEVERTTDEFELVTLQEPAIDPLEGKTAEVPKVSIFKKLFSRPKEVTQVEPAVAPPPSANPTFLVQKFRTFYNEVVVYKNQKAELTAGFATAIVTSYDADLSPDQAANSLAQRLQQMLELQLAESSWMGGEIQEQYPNAQYAMACLADEMLTNMEWPGQAAWGKHRLELTVFRTVASDLEVFKRIDKLLKNGPQTVGTRDLARVYLSVIASGFKGKYRPFDLPRALAEYRRRLYEFVYGGDALMLYADERRIFPEAVSVTVAGRGVKRFSLAQQWAAILVLLLVGYTVISHLAWKKVSADLKDIAGRVEQARNPLPNDTPNGGGGR